MAITKYDLGTLQNNSSPNAVAFGNVVVPYDGVLILHLAAIYGSPYRATTNVTVGGNNITWLDHHPVGFGNDSQPAATGYIVVTAGTYAVVWNTTGTGANTRSNCHMVLLTNANTTPKAHSYTDAAAVTSASISVDDMVDGDMITWFIAKSTTGNINWGSSDFTSIDTKTDGGILTQLGYHAVTSDGTKTAAGTWSGNANRKIFATAWEPRVLNNYSEEMTTGSYDLTGPDIDYLRGVVMQMLPGVYAFDPPAIERIVHVSAKITSTAFSVVGPTINITRQYVKKILKTLFGIRASWHSPMPDFAVKKRKNRWWKKLVHHSR